MNTKIALPTVADIARVLEAWADPCFAESYDNVGLQIGDACRPVRRGLIALDLTPAVVEEAVRTDASLVITHHPLFFHPLRSMTADDLTGSMALCLASAGIALYSAHTNLDAAPGGVSFALAGILGAQEIQPLSPRPDGVSGLGAVGRLAHHLTFRTFLQRTAKRLEAEQLRYVGALSRRIETVAVGGGACAGLTAAAMARGADVFVTADISYHRFFEVFGPDGQVRMALVDAGHYETEVHTETLLCQMLQEHFPDVQWQRTAHRTSPIRAFSEP